MPRNRAQALKASKSRSKPKPARVIKSSDRQTPTTGARVIRRKKK